MGQVFLEEKRLTMDNRMDLFIGVSVEKFENVNQGDWYPYKYDRANNLSVYC